MQAARCHTRKGYKLRVSWDPERRYLQKLVVRRAKKFDTAYEGGPDIL